MARETYNPIFSSKPYKNSRFSRLPDLPAPGFVNVLTFGQNGIGSTGTPLLISDTHMPTKQTILAGKYDCQTLIDIRPYSVSFDETLYSVDHNYTFQLTMYMTVYAEKPDQVLIYRVEDTAAAVQRALRPGLQELACQRGMEETAKLRQEIVDFVNRTPHLNAGLCLSEVSAQLRPDQRYIELQAGIQALHDKKHYETVRAGIAEDLSKLYEDPAKQVFAELAAGHITPEEAADRLNLKDAANFDEAYRRAEAFLRMFKEAQNIGAGSPEFLDQSAEQLFSILLSQIPHNSQGNTLILEDKSGKNPRLAPPED